MIGSCIFYKFSLIYRVERLIERCENDMVNLFKQALGEGWDITPAGGLTGNAYVAQRNNERLFLKRNSSPFLAVLSAEGLVPKLIWTKRMENGDVITAQDWLEGNKLRPWEMQDERVAHLLRKIHQSSELLHMLMRLGISPITPDESFKKLLNDVYESKLHLKYLDVQRALNYLEQLLPKTRGHKQVVCHCDLNHNNLMMTHDGLLYLIDWDNATIADPITDFGMVLNKYIPQQHWEKWLASYGVIKDKSLIERMYWYLILDALSYMTWHTHRHEEHKVNERLLELRSLNEEVRSTILN